MQVGPLLSGIAEQTPSHQRTLLQFAFSSLVGLSKSSHKLLDANEEVLRSKFPFLASDVRLFYSARHIAPCLCSTDSANLERSVFVA